MYSSTRKRKMYGLTEALPSPGPPRLTLEDFPAFEEGGQVEETPIEPAAPVPETKAVTPEPVAKKQKTESVAEESKEKPKIELLPAIEGRQEDKVNDLAAVDQRTYNSIKDLPISRITVVRSPVKPAIVTVLNVLSLGQLKKIASELGYDALFHLALKLTLSNGKSYRLEKNQNISLKVYEDYPKTEAFGLTAGVLKKKLTLSDLMNASLKKEGKSRFYDYDAFKNNCQMFIKSILQASGLMNPLADKFISQNTVAVAQALPGYVAPVAKFLTTVGSKADTLIQKFFGKKLFKQGGRIMT